jgi:hypothetical protein
VPTPEGGTPRAPQREAGTPSSARPDVPEDEAAGSVQGEHRSPYSWLQVLGLVTVAFVLGVLIYFALVQGGGGSTDGAPPPSVPSVGALVLPDPAASSPETGA